MSAAEQRWDENFENVRQFRDAHGRWPKKSEGALGNWCDNQRRAKKGKGGHRISPARIAKLDGIGFDWDTTRMPKGTVETVGPDAEPQQQKKAAPSRKRVHKADPEERCATRRTTEQHHQPMAAAAAFWTATAVTVAPDAEKTVVPSAAGPVTPVVPKSAGRMPPLRGTAFDDLDVIKSNF